MTRIEGLCVQSEIETPALLAILRSGRPDVTEAVGVTIEAYKELGFTPDVDTATQSLTANFTTLAGLGYDGRLYVEPPKAVSFDQIIGAADGKRAKGVETSYRYPNLWTPGTEGDSYTTEELNGTAPKTPEARLAVFNADKTTGVDPLLHFLNAPYDERYRNGAPQTQLKALEATSAEFATKHPEAVLRALGHRATVMNVLMDRIRGVKHKSADFILNQGYLRVPELGRRELGGDSCVGHVCSGDSRLGLGRSDGGAGSGVGVGVSVGLNSIEL